MNLKITTITNTNLVTYQANVNAFLLTIPANKILSVLNYAVGTAAAPRYITTITHLV